jgi:hypothetical protein
MDNSRASGVWSTVLNSVFTRTYGSVLTADEIQKRMDYVLENIRSIPAENLFKTLLYSDTTNEVGVLAVDFRLGFIGPNYKDVIANGRSRELDSFDNSELKAIINDNCIALNYYINDAIVSGRTIEFANVFGELNEIMTTVHRPSRDRGWDLHPHVNALRTVNQSVYEVVFEKPSVERRMHRSPAIHSYHGDRVKLFQELKRLYPSGVDAELVANSAFFG